MTEDDRQTLRQALADIETARLVVHLLAHQRELVDPELAAPFLGRLYYSANKLRALIHRPGEVEG